MAYVNPMTKTAGVRLVLGIAITAAICIFAVPPIAQNPDYHNFADRRALLGIPNVLDVLSNLPFLIVGTMGLLFLKARWSDNALFVDPLEKWPWLVLFGAIALASFGSAYYHWEPNNPRLTWDRLFIALAFMVLLAIIIAERIRNAPYMLPLLALAGVFSVIYWDYTERQGMGDLRPYALAQFLPILLIPLICALFPASYTGTRRLVVALGWYVLAKLFECFDGEIFNLLSVSGHTLKHLAAGMGAYILLGYLKHRRKIR